MTCGQTSANSGIVGARRQRQIELGALRAPRPVSSAAPVPGIEVAAVLVQVGEDHRGVVLEGVEHAIAVMRIDVDVGDARQAGRLRSCSMTTPQSLNTQKPAARSRAA